MILTLILAISLFLATNMGTSGFSISFAPSYASGIINKKMAVILYTLFLTMGALIIGPKVVETLTMKLVNTLDHNISGLLILSSASLTMFMANILKIPQSTSFIIVGSFAGAGIYFEKFNYLKLIEIFVAAVIFSFLAFILTYFIMKLFYPPREQNFRIYEKITARNSFIKKFILYANCYAAFAIGTNNVANVVAPLVISNIGISKHYLLLICAPFFGLGALLLGKGVINTVSKEIIPLGEISAMVISFVTSSFVITASLLGLPTPYVQFTTFSVLAISIVKDGMKITSKKGIVRKTFLVWFITPFITLWLTFFLHKIFVN